MEIRWQRWDVKFLYKLENCFNLKKKKIRKYRMNSVKKWKISENRKEIDGI